MYEIRDPGFFPISTCMRLSNDGVFSPPRKSIRACCTVHGHGRSFHELREWIRNGRAGQASLIRRVGKQARKAKKCSERERKSPDPHMAMDGDVDFFADQSGLFGSSCMAGSPTAWETPTRARRPKAWPCCIGCGKNERGSFSIPNFLHPQLPNSLAHGKSPWRSGNASS
ncbi:hypothetical protein KCU83_g486, partial [Aureobasidium melanogenum]